MSYWGHLDDAGMATMIRDAETEGWRVAMRRHLPEAVWSHIDEPGRTDGLFFVPQSSDQVVLDAGCMWGGLTVPLARRFARVHGLDATLASLDFLRVRAREEGLTNLELACGSLLSLPYRDGAFDLVIVNGVLEWVGFGRDYVVDRDFGRARPDGGERGADPAAMQDEALREVRRVLRRGGRLYLAIENRYAYRYFLVAPDDHAGLRFASLLPRRAADLYMRARLGEGYRTYTYSAAGLRRLLARAGLTVRALYGCFDSYHQPQAVIPIEERKMLAFYLRRFRLPNVPAWKRAAFRVALAAGLGPWLVPSFIVVAERPGASS